MSDDRPCANSGYPILIIIVTAKIFAKEFFNGLTHQICITCKRNKDFHQNCDMSFMYSVKLSSLNFEPMDSSLFKCPGIAQPKA